MAVKYTISFGVLIFLGLMAWCMSDRFGTSLLWVSLALFIIAFVFMVLAVSKAMEDITGIK